MSDLEPVARLSKDIVNAARTLSPNEARFLVDAYYQMQDNRIRDNHQLRAQDERNEPSDVLRWLASQNGTLEKQIARALERYAESQPLGQWCLSNRGIGPVITAGLMAHIDITKAPTVGHIWAFAGLDPTKTWDKGQKRPWNAALKTLCWKIGESFVKIGETAEGLDSYNRIYRERKDLEISRNEQGLFKEQAVAMLARKKFRAETDAKKHYEAGRLPPAHIHARAKRYAVKLFLAHYHEIAYKLHFGVAPPLPYPIAILLHAHKIEPLVAAS